MIVKPSDYLETDHRFRQWGKLICSKSDLDLSQSNGYSLRGQWVKWGESVSLQPGRWLIAASEYGSRASHSYHYRLIDGNGNIIDADNQIAVLDQALADGVITEDQRVKAKNSCLYSCALYISLYPE